MLIGTGGECATECVVGGWGTRHAGLVQLPLLVAAAEAAVESPLECCRGGLLLIHHLSCIDMLYILYIYMYIYIHRYVMLYILYIHMYIQTWSHSVHIIHTHVHTNLVA